MPSNVGLQIGGGMKIKNILKGVGLTSLMFASMGSIVWGATIHPGCFIAAIAAPVFVFVSWSLADTLEKGDE